MENRMHPRVRCEIESSFKMLGPGPVPPLNFTVFQDLSEGGIRFRSNHFLPKRSRLYFHFQIPKLPNMEALTELAWVRELPHLNCFEAGARFVEFPSQYKNSLKGYIYQNLISK
jgi:hypothetical protein